MGRFFFIRLPAIAGRSTIGRQRSWSAPLEVPLHGRSAMTTYILMINWTEQGIKNLRDSPKRLDAAKKALEATGGSFKDFYLTMGEFDMVAVCEAPDDAVLARFAMTLGMGGNVRTRTLKAFPESAYRELIANL
jgi:uncharacterized protein with GYD domain